MYGSRFWLWLSTKRQLVNDVARLERWLDHVEGQLLREREAALARRLPADLLAEADAAVAGRAAGSVVDELTAAASAVRAALPGIPAEARAPLGDWLDDHAAEHRARECMWVPKVCPAARTARALRREVESSDDDRAPGRPGAVPAG